MGEPKLTVLVVDDEPQVRSIICFVLESRGYHFLEAEGVEPALELMTTNVVDLVILDVMLPDGSGIELCRRIRSISDTPIILLSALGEVEHRVAGLEAGADDYITKPFSPREVALRVDVIVRRQHPAAERIEVGGLQFRSDTGVLACAQKQVALTTIEARVLASLLGNLNRTVTFQSLLEQVWQTQESVGGREMVRITVHRLRGRLREVGLAGDLIQSVRGSGYRFNGAACVEATT